MYISSYVATLAGQEEASTVFGLLGTVAGLGSTLMSSSGGNSADDITSQVNQLNTQLANQNLSQIETIGQIEIILVADRGKLLTVRNNVGTNPDWAWTQETTNNAITSLNAAARAETYTDLMPLSWPIWDIQPTSPGQTSPSSASTVCVGEGGDNDHFTYQPFLHAVAGNQFPAVTTWGSGGTTTQLWTFAHMSDVNSWWDNDPQHHTSLPSSSLTDQIFSTTGTGAYQYAPRWYRQTYNPPGRAVCVPSGQSNSFLKLPARSDVGLVAPTIRPTVAARVLVGFPTSPGIGVGPVVGPGQRKGVVVAADLDPAEVMSLDTEAVTAVVTAAGAPLSHAAILARSRGLPAVTGLGPQLLELAPGTVILVDGDAGTVIVDPTSDELGAAEDRRRATRQKRDEDGLRAHAPALTRDGHAVSVLANVGSVEDAEAAVRGGADGVGMLRTEFVFLSRSEPPGEQEQYDAYRRVAEALGDRPLVIRTLDLGADIPAWGAPPEPNPALGNRGIRFSLSFPEVLETQLRAVARLAVQRPVRVMFPMVTTVDELRRARACLDDVTRGSPAGAAAAAIEVGITVEVPAAALTAEAFVPLVEFFGVGTNDLTQYTLAVDRTNAAVAGITDGLHPAVLRLVRDVAAAGARHARPVCVVGELGTDPLAIPVLLGLGVATWSVRANAIAAVKEVVRQVRLDEARLLAEAALGAESAPAVRELAARRWAVVTGQA